MIDFFWFLHFFFWGLHLAGLPTPPFLSGPRGVSPQASGQWMGFSISALAALPGPSAMEKHLEWPPWAASPSAGRRPCSSLTCPAGAAAKGAEAGAAARPGPLSLSLPNLAALNRERLPPASYLIQLSILFLNRDFCFILSSCRNHSRHGLLPSFPQDPALASKAVGLIPTVPFPGHTLLIGSMISWRMIIAPLNVIAELNETPDEEFLETRQAHGKGSNLRDLR